MKKISLTTIAISIIVILGIIATLQKTYGAALAPENLPSQIIKDDQQNLLNSNNSQDKPKNLEEVAQKIFPQTKQETKITKPLFNIENFLWLIAGFSFLILLLSLPMWWMIKSSLCVWNCGKNIKSHAYRQAGKNQNV